MCLESRLKKKRERRLVCREGRREGAAGGAIEGKMEGLEAVKEQRVGAPGWRGVYACGFLVFLL